MKEEVKKNKLKEIFSPVEGGYGWMLLTYIYLIVLYEFNNLSGWIKFQAYSINFTENISKYIFTSGIISINLLIFIIPAIYISVLIYKPLVKALTTACFLLAILALYFLIALRGESQGYSFLYLYIMAIGLISGTGVGFLLRGFFRIKSTTIKVLLGIAPFLIILITTIFVISSGQNATLDSCDHAGEVALQIDCYYKLALDNNDPSICFKIKGAENVKAGCLYKLRNELTINTCLNNLDEKEKSDCYWDIAEIENSSIICDNIKDIQLRDNCKNYINNGKRVFS